MKPITLEQFSKVTKTTPVRMNFLSSLFNKWTGNGYTGAQQQQQDYETEMANTAFQRQVRDMQAAGLNPALLYGSGAGSGAATPSGPEVSGNGVDFGALMSLMMAPAQLKLLESQAAVNNAQAGLVDRNAAWVDRLNEGTLAEIRSRMKVNEADINAREYDNALKKAQELQILKETSWIDRINEAQTDAAKAKAAYDYAEAAISQAEKVAGHRMSSSEWLAIADSVIAALGADSPKVVVDSVLDALEKVVPRPQDSVSSVAGPAGRALVDQVLHGRSLYRRWTNRNKGGGR